MAERKFQVIQERPVGTLTKEHRVKWERLMQRQARIHEMQERLDVALKRFAHNFADSIRIKDPGEQKAYRGFRIDEEGTVWRTYCPCPACQAQLHGMTVTATVEEMIREDLIEKGAIPEIRKRAAELDAESRDALKTKLLVN